MRSMVLAGLAAAYLAVLIDLTLVRFPQPGPTPNLVPMRTIAACWEAGGRAMAVNVVGNLALMAPVGVLLPMVRPGRSGVMGAAVAGLGLSVGIEVAQFACGHRMADVDDVLLNTAGAAIGYAAGFAPLRAASGGRGRPSMGMSGGLGRAIRPRAAARPAR